MTEKIEDLIAELREYAVTIRAGDLPVGAALIEQAADRLAALTTPQENGWCREESCQYRHWRSGSMPTHQRGADCPEPPIPHEACTCPSGDGSLRWPCPTHPPTPLQSGAEFEALEQELWKHQPVLSMEDGSIRGCQCLDRVFHRGTEDWGTHLAEVFQVLSRAAAPEPEWEYGVMFPEFRTEASFVGVEDSARYFMDRPNDSVDKIAQPGDKKVLVRRRKAGPWLPVGGEN